MSYQFDVAPTSFPSYIVLPGRIDLRIISSSAQYDNKSNLHEVLLYINEIISYSFRVHKNDGQCVALWVPLSLFIISSTAAVIGWTIPRGMVPIPCGIDVDILFPFLPGYVWLAEPYHVVPLESKKPQCCSEAWNLSQYCFIFFTQTDTNMLCRLFNARTYMDIYLPIHQEYCYLEKQKISLYFSTSTCEHLWPSPSNLVNCTKCLHNPSKIYT